MEAVQHQFDSRAQEKGLVTRQGVGVVAEIPVVVGVGRRETR